jgi:Flp pilus assembly protein protease CpaA
LFTLLAGGVLGVVSVILSRRTAQFIGNLKLLLVSTLRWLRGSAIAPALTAKTSTVRIPYAVAIAAGVAIWLLRS